MKKTMGITRTLIAVTIAFVIAVSSAVVISMVRVDAKTYNGTAQSHRSQKLDNGKLPKTTTKTNQFAKAYCVKVQSKITKGSNWSYKSDAKNIKVSCKFDPSTRKYTFKLVGTSYGLNHMTLKYKTTASKWESKKMNVFVDMDKNIMRIS